MHLHLAALQKPFHSKVRNPFHIRVTMQQVVLRPITKYYNHHIYKLKLIDHLRATRWMPPDYWQTNNSNGLVMIIRNYHWLNSASRVLILTCSAPLVQTGEQFFTVRPWPLTYDPRLAKVKVYPHAENQGQRSNGSNRRAPTDKRMDTHGCYQTYYCPATRSIMTAYYDILALLINNAMWQSNSLFILTNQTDGKLTKSTSSTGVFICSIEMFSDNKISNYTSDSS